MFGCNDNDKLLYAKAKSVVISNKNCTLGSIEEWGKEEEGIDPDGGGRERRDQ